MITAHRELEIAPENYSLITDLYQLTMSACYVGEGIENKPASFELFVRRLPSNFGYLVAMGLAQVLEYLENWQFTSKQLEILERTGLFAHVPAKFWSLLESAKFTGDVWAVPEGTVVFPNEPIVRIDAPLWQAQLIETYLLNTINYQTLIATKAARIRDVAGKTAQLLEFGTRRAFSPQASLWAARAALAAGFDVTSNVLAALQLGQKPAGTMAHSLVMAINSLAGSEDEAFEAFHRYFPEATLLIDTYDSVAAAKRLAQKTKTGEMLVNSIRIDSGDLVELSQKIRNLFEPGDINIFASGDLDEWEIDRLLQNDAVIDGYGIGTKLVTGVPVNGVYKLVEIDGIPTIKESSSKTTYPGRKQIFRTIDNANFIQDRLGLADEIPREKEQPLLQLMMQQGERIQVAENLATIRQRTNASVATLAQETRRISNPIIGRVEISDNLESLFLSLSKKPAILTT